MKLNKKKILFFSIFVSLILFSMISGFRILKKKPILPEDRPYHHLKMAEEIKDSGIPIKDPSIQRPYLVKPYHLILSWIDPILGSIIIPVICGIISLFLFYWILEEFNIGNFRILTSCLVLILSPLFLFTFSVSNKFCLDIVFLLAGFLFFIKKSKYYFLPCLLIFSMLPFFGMIPFLFGIFSIFVYTLKNKNKLKRFYLVLISSLIILLVYYIPFVYHYGFPGLEAFSGSNILVNLVSDFGGSFGFGIFNFILFFVGLFVVWKIKKQIIAYSCLFLFLILSFFIPEINIYLNFLLAIFAGFGFAYIIKMRWKIDLIKKLTFILIICGLLFSTISYVTRMVEADPSDDIVDSLIWLENHSDEDDVTFSYHEKGHWIEFFGGTKVVLDSKFYYVNSLDKRINDTETIFYSRDLEKTKKLLDRYSVDYIWIDNKMKKGQVWTRKKEGLLFLFRNSKTFDNVYDEEGIEIWKVLRID